MPAESLIPTIKPNSSLRITDRKTINYYDLHIPDESYLALLELIEDWKHSNPAPHHHALQSLFDLLTGLKFPQDALLARQARTLLLASQTEVVYICPYCKHHKLDNILRLTGECVVCQLTVVLEDAFQVIPQMTTETVLSYLQRGPHGSNTTNP